MLKLVTSAVFAALVAQPAAVAQTATSVSVAEALTGFVEAPYKGAPIIVRVVDKGSCYASRIDQMRSTENERIQRVAAMKLRKLHWAPEFRYSKPGERTMPGDGVRVFSTMC